MESSPEFKRYLVSSFNADLILPLYSVFVPLLALTLKASIFEIGLVGGASNAVYCFMPFVMGRFSDRHEVRKFFVASSFVVLTLVSLFYVVVQNPVALIAARIVEGIGWAMLWPAVEAAVRDSTTDSKRALSLFNFTWSGAAAAGPLVGSAIVFATTIRDAFVVSTAVMLVTLALNVIPLLMRRNDSPMLNAALPVQIVGPSVPSDRLGAKFYLPAMVLGAISSGVLYTFLTSYAKSIHISVLLVGLATFMFGFVRFLVYVLTVRDRFRSLILDANHRVRNVVISLVVCSLASLFVLVHDPSGVIYVAAYGIAGAGYSIVYAVSQAVMIAEADPTKVGRSAGKFECSIGVGQFLGPVAAGAISGGSYSMPFIAPTLSLIVFLAALPAIARRRG